MDCLVHLYVDRLHCLNLSNLGPIAVTAATDDADNLATSGIDTRRSIDADALNDEPLPKKKKEQKEFQA